MHSLVDSCCVVTRDQTPSLGVTRWCSNQLSYLARARNSFSNKSAVWPHFSSPLILRLSSYNHKAVKTQSNNIICWVFGTQWCSLEVFHKKAYFWFGFGADRWADVWTWGFIWKKINHWYKIQMLKELRNCGEILLRESFPL